MPSAPHPDRRAIPAQRPAASRLQVSSIEVWPAAGGGLLLGMIVPGLSGAVVTRPSIKNLFLRLGPRNQPAVIVPYVRLEPEVRLCAAAVAATELRLGPDLVAIDNEVVGPDADRALADLCPACELGLALVAAVARRLLTAAAAEIWRIPPGDCVVERGVVQGPRQRASYADLAADAALLSLPRVVFLASGRPIKLRSAHG